MNAVPRTWQKGHVDHLVDCLSRYPYALDASDTGTGKTYVSLFVAKALSQRPFVVAPKIVLSAWQEAARDCGIKLQGVMNIEMLKRRPALLKRKADTVSGRKRISNWEWKLPEGTLVIWDEAQNAGGQGTQNARIMRALRPCKLPCLAMSATIAQSPMQLQSLGYLLGLHKYTDYRAFCVRHGCVRNPWAGGHALMFTKSKIVAETKLLKLHENIFPEKGGRLRIKDIPDFPESQVFADAYDLPDHKLVQEAYDEFEAAMEGDTDELPIVARLRAKQRVEWLKVPIFVDLTLDTLEEGRSVVIFVNYRETLDRLSSELHKKHIDSASITGGQSQTQRDYQIKRFQTNGIHVMLVMIQAGGAGIGLHDLLGRPRTSLLSPPDNIIHLKQALGRIPRDGAKSKSIQKLVFCANTVEADICSTVN
jgi:superfamily II DNA or RNA helicase